MADPSNIGEHILSALGGGAISFLASLRSAAAQFTKLKETVSEHADKIAAHAAEIRDLKRNTEPYTHRSGLEDFKRALGEELKLLASHRIEDVKRALRVEVESFKDDLNTALERRARELERQTNPGFNTLEDFRRRVEGLERALERMREKNNFVTLETFNDFTEGQNGQWNEMNRTLGQIMGALKIKPPR